MFVLLYPLKYWCWLHIYRITNVVVFYQCRFFNSPLTYFLRYTIVLHSACQRKTNYKSFETHSKTFNVSSKREGNLTNLCLQFLTSWRPIDWIEVNSKPFSKAVKVMKLNRTYSMKSADWTAHPPIFQRNWLTYTPSWVSSPPFMVKLVLTSSKLL